MPGAIFAINMAYWIIPVAAAVSLLAASFYSYLLFHTLAELIAVFVGVMAFVVVWQTYPFTRNNFLMFLGTGYFWISLLDLAHALTYKGMNIYPASSTNTATQFWIAARYCEAFLLLVAPIFLSRTLKKELAFFAFGAVSASLYAAVMHGIFPDCYIDGAGLTGFKIYSEYAIDAVLLLAAGLLWEKSELMEKRMLYLITSSIALTMGAELFFTFYIDVYGLSNLAGHILRFFSSWLIFVSIITTTLTEPFMAMARGVSTYDAVPDASIVTDEAGIIRQVNRQACIMANAPESAMLGKHCHDFFHPPSMKREDCEICSDSAAGMRVLRKEINYADKGKWFDISLSPLRTESGFRGSVQVIREITDRKWAEDALLRSYELLERRVKERTTDLLEANRKLAREMETRRTAETAQRKSEEMWRSLLENAPDLILNVDKEGTILLVNRPFSMPGKDIVPGAKIFEYFDPSFRESAKGKLDLAFATGFPEKFEARSAGDVNSARWLAVRIGPIEFEGTVTGATLIARDLTDRKRMEELLRESKEQYKVLFLHNPDAVYSIDPSGRFVTVNPATTRISGYSEDELLAMESFRNLLSPTDLPSVEMNFRKTLEGEPRNFDAAIFSKSGKRVELEVSTMPIILNGTVTGLYGIAKDVTARNLAERELRESRERLTVAQETANIGNWERSLETNRLLWSEQMYRIFGLDTENFAPSYESFLERLHPDDRMMVAAAIRKCVEDDLPYVIDYRTITPYGETRYIHARGRILKDKDGRPEKISGTALDITERKLFEESLKREKERAEEATRIKDKFVMMVSHDLRGPLNSIYGYLKLTRGEAKGSGKVEELLDKAILSTENMIKIIHDLLGRGRLRKGKMEPSHRFFNGHVFSSAIVEDLSYLARHKGIAIVNNIPEGTRLYADETLFYGVVQNLVNNAIKFCEPGDVITLYVPEGEKSAIAVSDTGIGVDAERIPSLFEREGASTNGTAGEVGTGLGLPLSRDIVAAHNGSLDLVRGEEKGSTFIVRLPHVRPRLLLVDDEELERRFLAEILGRMDVEILEAENGRNALRVIRNETPHMVITDLMMPEMSGLELAREARRDSSLRSLPIIALTSNTDMEMREKAFQCGISDYIPKPVKMEDLFPRIRRFIG